MNAQDSELIQDLLKEEERHSREEELLREAEESIRKGEREDERVLERFWSAKPKETPIIDPEALETDRIFSEGAIRELCIKYRLRFLNTRHFKDELPYEAVSCIKRFEARVGQSIEDLRIIAPGERFQLQDSQKDPLLFAYLGKGKYYLLHRWGQDLSVWRKMLHYPFRNLWSLLNTCAALSLLISLLLPANVFQAEKVATTELLVLFRAMSFFLLSSFFMTATLIFGVTTSKEFSSDQWNSKFFN